jgi:uncharacterized repeat protein (TIGR03803 family)
MHRLICTRVLLATLLLFTLMHANSQSVQAQTFTVIHNFTGGKSGAQPNGLTIDRDGNLYGTTVYGGTTGPNCAPKGCGTVFKLKRSGTGWVSTPLYTFIGGSDGVAPAGRVIFGPDGSLYGTTLQGGEGNCQYLGGPYTGCGTVFKLRPPARACKTAPCDWTETVLYRFTGGVDGGISSYGDLVFDQAGNIYGTTISGGSGNGGTVYELTPSHGDCTESTLYSFTEGADGGTPFGSVIFDSAGNLYGTTSYGGKNDLGTVFQLAPSGSGWAETVLYNFKNGDDGSYPFAGLIFDGFGNLYGSTISGGTGGGGTIFTLTPSNGHWTLTTIHSFTGIGGPAANLLMDVTGNLYGTTVIDGVHEYGSVFKLTHSNGGWAYNSFHDFTFGSDGAYPESNVVFDANGNLYGTASSGGAGCWYGCGVVWEIMPVTDGP